MLPSLLRIRGLYRETRTVFSPDSPKRRGIRDVRRRPSVTHSTFVVNRKRCPFPEGIDLTQNPPKGYPGVDSRLLQIRLRTLPLVSQAGRDNVLTVLIPLCQLAARTLQDALFESVTSRHSENIPARAERSPVATPRKAQTASPRTTLSTKQFKHQLAASP